LVVCRAFTASRTNCGTKVPRGLKSALRRATKMYKSQGPPYQAAIRYYQTLG
jgi:hypothetical protein